MIRTIFALCLAASTTACAVPAKQVSGPDGRTAYSLKCSGMGRTKEDCYQKAGEICPNGYNVADDSSRLAGVYVTQYAAIPINQDYLLISCRTPVPQWSGASAN
jgi:hypothetical protein